MIPYFLIYFYTFYRSLISNVYTKSSKIEAYLIIFTLTIFIGTRNEIGADWFTYLPYLDSTSTNSIFEVLKYKDPSYRLINWFFSGLDNGIYYVNTVCALIFSFCIVKFCESLPNFWLALNLSIPYLIFVVGMGYTRQSVALSLIMYGFTFLEKRRFLPYFLTLFSAFTFHGSAIFNSFYILFFLRSKYLFNKFIYLLLVLIFGYFFFDLLYSKVISDLIGTYFSWRYYQSDGVFIRLIMNLIPGILFLLILRKYPINNFLKIQSTIQSILALLLFLIFLYFPSLSTPIDRFSLYLIPLQVTILCYLVKINLFNIPPKYIKLLLLSYSASTFIIWFNFANHAYLWLPYRSILFNS